MTDHQVSAQASSIRKKKRLDRTMIIVAILAIIGLTILQTHVVRLGTGVPMSYGLLVFILINVNVLLLFVLLFLVLRNLYKIFFEEHQIMATQLRTKLVVAFVSLSLVPTGLLFYAGWQFIATGHDYWFDQNVEQSLVDSLNLAQSSMEADLKLTVDLGGVVKKSVLENHLYLPENRDRLPGAMPALRRDYKLALLEIYSVDLTLFYSDVAPEHQEWFLPALPSNLVQQSTAQDSVVTRLDTVLGGDVIRAIWPLRAGDNRLYGFLVVGRQIGAPLREKTQAVAKGLALYRDLKRLHDPIRVSHFIALTIVALISIFVSTWIGFHLAKGITGPIMDLATGTKRIAQGDYDFTIEVKPYAGEIETLVTSFNRMTRDLKAGKAALTAKNVELLASNTELDQRRRYMEIILQNVATGVVAADAHGVITTFNHSAAEIMHIKPDQVLGQRYQEVMAPAHRAVLEDLLRAAESSPRGSADRQVKARVGGLWISLRVHLSLLKDENEQDLGVVIVFDDLSELEKAQRMAAWREVARRIAHEIKNPLTPIQLSTQRLRRRYAERLADDSQLFDECTQMIIRQVEELKYLVNEFSNFARMPEANPTPNDLKEIVDETVLLYSESHKDVVFSVRKDQDLPVFNLDREQMKRVLINLLDNAVAAVDGHGHVEVTLIYDRLLRLARLDVADDGVGISAEDKSRLFEPYFSTKKSGTGLGLAIVRTIVADHNGFVRVQNNQLRGTRFIIELPVRT